MIPRVRLELYLDARISPFATEHTLHRTARAGLQFVGPAVRPKTAPRPDAKIKSDGVNDVWCVDVVFDTTQHGTTVKFLTVLDEYSHYNLDIAASRRIGSR